MFGDYFIPPCFGSFIFLKISLAQLKEFFTYSSIKFDNLYLKWNFIRISLWKWKKWILFYEKSLSNIILIKNTKLYLFIYFYGCVCIYNLSNKKNVYIYVCVCVYNKKTCVCIYIYIYMYVGVILINILMPQLGPPNKNFWLCSQQWAYEKKSQYRDRKICRYLAYKLLKI